MRLRGQQIETNYVHPFSLRRANGQSLNFQLSPLPLGFQSKLRQRGIFPPQPPLKISRDSTGKPLRDAAGQAVTHHDLADESYREANELYHQRVAMLALFESLRNDSAVEFETSVPSEKKHAADEWTTFADSLFQELESAGLTAGDLLALCDEIGRISNLVDSHLAQAQANFSPAVTSRSP